MLGDVDGESKSNFQENLAHAEVIVHVWSVQAAKHDMTTRRVWHCPALERDRRRRFVHCSSLSTTVHHNNMFATDINQSYTLRCLQGPQRTPVVPRLRSQVR